jgi:hypothetical protein
VPEGHEDHGCVPVTVVVGLGGLDQGLDLARRQNLDRASRSCPNWKPGRLAGVASTVTLLPARKVASLARGVTAAIGRRLADNGAAVLTRRSPAGASGLCPPGKTSR